MRLLVTGGAVEARFRDPRCASRAINLPTYRSAARAEMTPTWMGKGLKDA
ncbi:hypothetical protein [Pseudomonas sp.]|nr:hypothetical protein [Pseudomonas sp.]